MGLLCPGARAPLSPSAPGPRPQPLRTPGTPPSAPACPLGTLHTVTSALAQALGTRPHAGWTSREGSRGRSDWAGARREEGAEGNDRRGHFHGGRGDTGVRTLQPTAPCQAPSPCGGAVVVGTRADSGTGQSRLRWLPVFCKRPLRGPRRPAVSLGCPPGPRLAFRPRLGAQLAVTTLRTTSRKLAGAVVSLWKARRLPLPG